MNVRRRSARVFPERAGGTKSGYTLTLETEADRAGLPDFALQGGTCGRDMSVGLPANM